MLAQSGPTRFLWNGARSRHELRELAEPRQTHVRLESIGARMAGAVGDRGGKLLAAEGRESENAKAMTKVSAGRFAKAVTKVSAGRFPKAMTKMPGEPFAKAMTKMPSRSFAKAMTRMSTGPFFCASLVALPIAGCGGDARPAADDAGVAREAALVQAAGDTTGSREVDMMYAPDLQVDLNTMAHMPSGLYMKDITVGQGERVALNGAVLRVHYTGWLSNGVEFDSSRDENQPIEFTMGQGEVLRGWEEALTGMRAGGRRLIVLPPALGFGEGGLPGVVPPNSTLVFDLEIVEIVP